MSYFNLDGKRTVTISLTIEEKSKKEQEWRQYLESIPQYPRNRFYGRGIVICGGGLKYFTCAWVCIKRLREIGCQLPIEVWHDSSELTEGCITNLRELGNVTCQDFSKFGLNDLKGYMYKPFSILYSDFEEVLSLDADNICVFDPEDLFDLEIYKTNGALFWPDFWETPSDNPIWGIMGIPFIEMKEQESGQILVNKQKSWEALHLCTYLNKEEKFYYELLHGDKDTFRFAWLALEKPFGFIRNEPGICGYFDKNSFFLGNTIVQYDNNYVPYFLHRNLLKWESTIDKKLKWRAVKRFEKAKKKGYLIKYSESEGHFFLDFVGDYKIHDFRNVFGELEESCLNSLVELRNMEFYKEFKSSST